jgi:hypothetical protein
MIVHEITKYLKEFKTSYYPSFTPPTQYDMGKLEYAMFLRNLPYKVGDWVVSRHVNTPLLKREVFKVVAIDEIHRFVTFGHPTVGPMCLTLASMWGDVLTGRHGANVYRKVDDHELPI